MTEDNQDDERYAYSDTRFVEALRSIGGVGATKEVADEIGCHRDTARRRLIELEEKGKVSRRDVGNAALWTLSE